MAEEDKKVDIEDKKVEDVDKKEVGVAPDVTAMITEMVALEVKKVVTAAFGDMKLPETKQEDTVEETEIKEYEVF